MDEESKLGQLSQQEKAESNDEAFLNNGSLVHSTVSPPTAAEAFFLPQLRADHISAFALAAQIQQEQRRAPSCTSGATEDFESAAGELPDDVTVYYDDVNFANDTIPEEEDFEITDKMSATVVEPPVTATPVVTPEVTQEEVAPATPETSPKVSFDVSQHIYEGAKGVWSFGKGIFIVKPFLGIAEGMASKVVGVVGSDLESVDKNLIKPKLVGLDTVLINPIVGAVVGVVTPAVQTAGNVVTPIFKFMLKPFGLMIEDEKKEPEEPAAAEPAEPATQTITEK